MGVVLSEWGEGINGSLSASVSDSVSVSASASASDRGRDRGRVPQFFGLWHPPGP